MTNAQFQQYINNGWTLRIGKHSNADTCLYHHSDNGGISNIDLSRTKALVSAQYLVLVHETNDHLHYRAHADNRA